MGSNPTSRASIMKYRELLFQLVTPHENAEIVKMLEEGMINRQQAREVLDKIFLPRKEILDRLLLEEIARSIETNDPHRGR